MYQEELVWERVQSLQTGGLKPVALPGSDLCSHGLAFRRAGPSHQCFPDINAV